MDKKKILFVSHDFKFLTHIIHHFSRLEKYEVALYHHKGHVIQDFQGLAKECLKADIIFCEWGLENLSWLSRNKFPDQKIIVRIHLQEFVTPFLTETNWNHVNKIILVGPHMLRKFKRTFPDFKDNCRLIYNIIDTNSFNLPKTDNAVFNIGSLGVLPSRKAPHLGLELLLQLKKIDKRYKYIIKSKKPEELDWLWKKEKERNYYTSFFENISKLGLEDSVIWEEHGKDVQEWFQKIQHVFSPSEFESFHMAIPEGMASGAIPIIRNWEGADQLYPKKFVFKDIQEAVHIIRKYSDNMIREKEEIYLKNYAQKHFGLNVILKQYEQLFEEVATSIENDQQKITLRNIYHDISTATFNKANKKFTKNSQESDTKLSSMQNEHHELKKIKDNALHEITRAKAQLHEVNTQLAVTQDRLIASKKRETDKENKIVQLMLEKEHNLNNINKIKENLHSMQQKLVTIKEREQENEKIISKLTEETKQQRQKHDAINAQLTEVRQMHAEALVRESNKEQKIEEINNTIQEQTNEITILKKQLSEKDHLLLEKQSHLNEREKMAKTMIKNAESMEETISELKKQLNSSELSAESKQMKIIEQKQYISYLEKRFFNKIIGIIRKKTRHQSDSI
jgi:glycosyltransferase involved in cell wall biosynthesis